MYAVDSTFLLEIVSISVDTMCCILHVQVTLIQTLNHKVKGLGSQIYL